MTSLISIACIGRAFASLKTYTGFCLQDETSEQGSADKVTIIIQSQYTYTNGIVRVLIMVFFQSSTPRYLGTQLAWGLQNQVHVLYFYFKRTDCVMIYIDVSLESNIFNNVIKIFDSMLKEQCRQYNIYTRS